MNISKYVSEYLQLENIASLRGLGSFRKNKITGRFDHESGSFLPPSTEILFQLQEQDSDAFEQYIAEKENISSEEAQEHVKAFSVESLNSLEKGEAVSLEGVGQLKQEGDALILIIDLLSTPDEFFGYPILPADDHAAEGTTQTQAAMNAPESQELNPEIEENPVNTEQDIHDIETVIPDTEKEIEPENEVISEPKIPQSDTASSLVHSEQREEEEAENSSKGWLRWLIIFFVLGVLVALLYMAKPDLFNGFQNNKDTTENTIVNVPADSLKQDSLNNALAQDTMAASPVVLTDTITYEIVVSAEKRPERIEQIVSSYEKMGYKVKVLPGNRLKKISVGSYSSRKEANDSLQVVKRKINIPGIYIFEQKY